MDKEISRRAYKIHDALVGIFTIGIVGLIVNREFLDLDVDTETTEGVLGKKLYDYTTLFHIDDEGRRIVPRYHFVPRPQ